MNIGVDKSTTGNTAGVSQSILAALDFAIQTTSSLDGHPIHIFFQEAPCNPQPHLQSASILTAQPDLAVIIGPICQAETGKFTKLISDAGQVLLSPGPLLDSPGQPGWFRVYPSLEFQASAVLQQLSVRFPNKNISIIVQNQDIDLQLSNKLCEHFTAKKVECKIILTLDNNADDPTVFSNLFQVNEPGVFLVISTFGDISGFTGLTALNLNQDWVFYDPEFGPLPESLPVIFQKSLFITLKPAQNAADLISRLPSDQPTISGLFAYDAFQILIKALTAAGQVQADGSLIIPRQGLRDAIQQVGVYEGKAAHFNCLPGGDCALPESLLTMIQPNQKGNP